MVCDIMLVMAVWLEEYSLNRLGSPYMLGCVGGNIPSYLPDETKNDTILGVGLSPNLCIL